MTNKHPLQCVWQSMKARCHNTEDKAYPEYGGRGIKVCERWRDTSRGKGNNRSMGFRNFLEDMGPRPTDDHSLDRINNDLGYDPSNCRWSTSQEQSLNRRPYGEVKERWVSRNKGGWGKPYKARFRHPETHELIACGYHHSPESAHLAACAKRLETYWRI